MRFDDRLDTILRLPARDGGARVAIWRQMVDILAQGEGQLSSSLETALVERLERWRAVVPQEQRRQSAMSLSGRANSPAIVTYFGHDRPSVAAPVLLSARLSDADWMAIIPVLPPASRALLRERRDFSADVGQLLMAYQGGDFALPQREDAVPAQNADWPNPAPLVQAPSSTSASFTAEAGVHGPIQISELVARIEAYRQSREHEVQSADAQLPIPRLADAFRFETSVDGIITWMEGAPRGPVIGLSIAEMADARSAGVDGHAAGAFRQRNRFRDARLLVAGEGASGGQWLISGDPVFDSASGRFMGFRGTARRPAPDELAGGRGLTLFGGDLQPDSIRQLVHELRTPLNAIRGFAEMIEGQFLGPVSQAYRNRAVLISAEATTLLRTIEDLDAAARFEAGKSASIADTKGSVSCTATLDTVLSDLASLLARADVAVDRLPAPSSLKAACDAVVLERIYTRLLAAMIGLAKAGERIPVSLDLREGNACLLVGLPDALKSVAEADLLDPNFVPSGDWPDAPALGLGFSLRLVSNLAQAEMGGLSLDRGRLSLNIPVATDSASGPSGRMQGQSETNRTGQSQEAE